MKVLFTAVFIFALSACSAGKIESDVAPVAVNTSVELDDLGAYLMDNGALTLTKERGVNVVQFCFNTSVIEKSCLNWPISSLGKSI